MYKLKNDVLEKPCMIIKNGNMYIPFNQGNVDYQEYLKWVEKGNTPEPADEIK